MRFYYIVIVLFVVLNCNPIQNEQNNQEENNFSVLHGLEILKISESIQLDPDNPALYYERSRLFYENGGYEEALKDIYFAIEKKEDNPIYFHLLADILLDYYRSEEALKVLEEAMLKFETDDMTFLKYAEFNYLLKQFDQSLFALNQLIDRKPLQAEAYFMVGLNFRELGDTLQAIRSFQKAIDLNPELIDGWINIGQMYGLLRDSRALQYFESALRIQPNHVTLLHAKAYYLQSVDLIKESIAVFQQIIQIDPYYTPAYFNSGLLYLDIKEYEQAINQFSIAIKTDPLYLDAYYFRGMTYELSGKGDLATADYKQVLVLDPENSEGKIALQKLK
jgi:tetratricopeptide (TPR) repeat protein